MSKDRPDAGAAPFTLNDLLARLYGIVRCLAAPAGLDVAATSPIFFDRRVETEVAPGQLVLAVGVDLAGPDGERVVQLAAERRASAVVFKEVGADPRAVEAGERATVAILEAARDIGWGRLFSLIDSSSVATGSLVTPGAVAGSLPGGLFDVANAIAVAVGGAVSVEDPFGTILAYSTIEGQPVDEIRRQGILGRVMLDEPDVRESYHDLARADGVIRFPAREHDERFPDSVPRLAIVVRAQNEILGQIWVLDPEGNVAEDAEHILEDAARMTAMHLVRLRAEDEADRAVRAESLRALLEGRGTSASAATELGIPAESMCAVVAFGLSVNDDAGRQIEQRRLIDLIQFYSETFSRPAACSRINDIVYMLLPIEGSISEERLHGLGSRIADAAEDRLGSRVRVGIGSPVRLRDAARSRREADRVLLVLASSLPDTQVARIEDVRAKAVLSELRELASDATLPAGALEEMLDRGSARDRVLIATLRAYLEAFGNVPDAAGMMGVHQNTFRYRLRQLRGIIDLDDPDERFVAELQLRLRDPGQPEAWADS